MQTNPSRFIMERSVERIFEKACEIQFKDFDAITKVLNEFTQIIAKHYDLFETGILKNISVIEVNINACREANDTDESIKCWENARRELMDALAMVKKEGVL